MKNTSIKYKLKVLFVFIIEIENLSKTNKSSKKRTDANKLILYSYLN